MEPFSDFCRLFIDTDLSIIQLKEILLQSDAGLCSSNTPPWFQSSIWLSSDVFENFDVENNSDYRSQVGFSQEDAFLFYPYTSVINIVEGTSVYRYIQSIKKIVWYLRDNGLKVVPACDFEDELNQR